MSDKYFIRQSVEQLLDQIDQTLMGVLDKYIEERKIKGWTRYHDELDKYPIGEYNNHLNWIVSPISLQEDDIIKTEDGWEYRAGKFVKTMEKMISYDKTTQQGLPGIGAKNVTFYFYKSKGCIGKNIPPEAWKFDGIIRMNSEGFMSGDGLVPLQFDKGKPCHLGDECPICDLWGVKTKLIQVPGKNPDQVYCPRQVIHRWSFYKGIEDKEKFVEKCKQIIGETDGT